MMQHEGSPFALRKTLRLLRRPELLGRDPLARRLRESFKTQSCRDALVLLIDRAFAQDPGAAQLRDLLVRCDLRGQKARAAAAEMNLSIRQFFRWRAAAIGMLATAIQELGPDDRSFGSDFREPIVCSRCGALRA